MREYQFTVILAGAPELTEELADQLYSAGCDDGSPRSCEGCTEVAFDREAPSLEDAIRSAVAQVQTAGCVAERVVIEADSDLLKV